MKPSESSTLENSPNAPHGESTERTSEEVHIPLRDLLDFPVIISVANMASLAFIEIALVALLPLFYSSSIEHGGLGLEPSTIGLLLGMYGVVCAPFQVLFFAPIIRRWGAKKVFIVAMSAFLPIYALFPIISILARQSGLSPIVWVITVCQLLLVVILDMAHGEYFSSMHLSMTFRAEHTLVGCLFIFLSSAAPTKRSLGAVNGLGQTVASGFRAIGPAAATSFFAVSVQKDILGGYAVYLLLFVLSCLSLLLAAHLPRQPGKQ